eukprot:947724-Pleurochrysis_carterae.AAC.1
MNAVLAEALLASASPGTDPAGRTAHDAAPPSGAAATADGGRLADGPRLSAYLRERVDAARAAAPRSASLRNLAAESPGALAVEAL